MKYRKKPVAIEAFCLGVDFIPDWFMDRVSTNEIILRGERNDLRHADINTLEGTMRGDKGDYIIRGYPCKPDIFAATYEAVEESAANVLA